MQAGHVPCSPAPGLHVLHVSSFKHRHGSVWLPWAPCVPGCRAGEHAGPGGPGVGSTSTLPGRGTCSPASSEP